MSWGHLLFYFMFGMAIIYFPKTTGECSLKHPSSSDELDCATVQDGLYFECYGEYISYAPKWYCLLTSLNDSWENPYIEKIVIKQNITTKCKENHKSEMPMPLGTIHTTEIMTVQVFDENNCATASFSGRPKELIRCSPPTNMSFERLSGRLNVSKMKWKSEDERHIETFALRYRELNSVFWNESQSTERVWGSVEHLDPSLSYEVQLGCSPNTACPKCPWSPAYLLPPELNVQPVILNVEDIIDAGQNGRRILLISWKYPSREPVKGYRVMVVKASGEKPRKWIPTDRPEMRLIVSHSAYRLKITAVNEASRSPAARRAVPARRHGVSDGGRLNVSFHSNKSLTLSWRDSDALKPIVCYSVELSSRGPKTQYTMFFQQSKTSKLIKLKEPLEPYQMYNIMLHTRSQKGTCNLKSINNSESTYGSLQAYYREGAPVSAPTNISSSNVTLTSMVLTWRPVPEEDLRGHLLGYTLHYKENGQPHTSTPRNTTVDPTVVSQELVDLKSGTVYTVQISAFTSAGVGVKSAASYFETPMQKKGRSVLHGGVRNSLITCSVLICVILFSSPLYKRAKRSFWPNVPNPGTSNAIQRMIRTYELEPLKRTSLLEECDTCTFHLCPPPGPQYTGLQGSGQLPGTPPSREEPPLGDTSDGSTCGSSPDDTRTTTPDPLRMDPEGPPGKGPGDYTTMELFQQGVHPLPPACRTTGHAGLHGEGRMNKTVHGNGSDYTRQSSQSPKEADALQTGTIVLVF